MGLMDNLSSDDLDRVNNRRNTPEHSSGFESDSFGG